MHGEPTPLWVSTYTSYLLYKVQDPFIACRKSISRNIVSFSLSLREDQSLLHRPRTQEENVHGGPTSLWVRTYTRYLLIPLAHVDSPTAETILLSLHFYGGQIFAPNINKLRIKVCLVGQFSHLSLNKTFFPL